MVKKRRMSFLVLITINCVRNSRRKKFVYNSKLYENLSFSFSINKVCIDGKICFVFFRHFITNVRQMKRVPSVFSQKINFTIAIIVLLLILTITQWSFDETSLFNSAPFILSPYSSNTTMKEQILLYRRRSCSCTRPLFKHNSNLLIIDETTSSLCSRYSTLRGFHQRIISISMYGPIDNGIFTLNTSLNFLHELISDMRTMYPDWILRIYHDRTIQDDVICSIECTHNNVDFCNASSLGDLGSLSSYIPAKIWRFLPAGDELVDIMASRDLDSPITQRELDAVNEWISSGKAWHAMRDHPMHYVPMLGENVLYVCSSF